MLTGASVPRVAIRDLWMGSAVNEEGEGDEGEESTKEEQDDEEEQSVEEQEETKSADSVDRDGRPMRSLAEVKKKRAPGGNEEKQQSETSTLPFIFAPLHMRDSGGFTAGVANKKQPVNTELAYNGEVSSFSQVASSFTFASSLDFISPFTAGGSVFGEQKEPRVELQMELQVPVDGEGLSSALSGIESKTSERNPSKEATTAAEPEFSGEVTRLSLFNDQM